MAEGPEHPVAREIRAARAYAGMSREQLAIHLGVSAETIGGWERGRFTRTPAQAMLVAIARYTRVPTSFELVTAAPLKPSVAERARAAAQRLGGTPGSSSETDGAQDAGGGSS